MINKIFSRFLNNPTLQAQQFKAFLNVYPPYIGAGIRTRHVSNDFTEIDVEMPLRWYNKNYFGTQFGGNLYSMADPFYCLMLVKQLGRNYIVWDKGADINFVAPGAGPVTAEFRLSPFDVAGIKVQAESGQPVLPEFTVEIKDSSGKVVATVTKHLYVRKKKGS